MIENTKLDEWLELAKTPTKKIATSWGKSVTAERLLTAEAIPALCEALRDTTEELTKHQRKIRFADRKAELANERLENTLKKIGKARASLAKNEDLNSEAKIQFLDEIDRAMY